MKKGLIIILIVAAILSLFGGCSVSGGYNNAVALEENATTAWNNVESSYQRRADLIGNLVKTVQGAADFERKTLTEVIEARSKATSTTIDIDNLSPQAIQKFQQAQSGLSSALSRLLVSVERYPDIKANRNFLELQSQLEGTENRITIARNRYNEAVKVYNTHIRQFPFNLFNAFFGFEKMHGFQAEEGAEKAPDVNFEFN
ncbi:MAG: LemA family protein [Flavobacteriaceae bacterium]|nr:LemA family protein [Flavobacteriaceae bacterium]